MDEVPRIADIKRLLMIRAVLAVTGVALAGMLLWVLLRLAKRNAVDDPVRHIRFPAFAAPRNGQAAELGRYTALLRFRLRLVLGSSAAGGASVR
jgi:hypothetical protein